MNDNDKNKKKEVFNAERNIIVIDNEEDDFDLAYQQMINKDEIILDIGNVNYVVNEQKDIEKTAKKLSTQKQLQTTNLYRRSNSEYIGRYIAFDILDIPVKYKSCKRLQHINLL